jgi:putative ABC transport system permease protein
MPYLNVLISRDMVFDIGQAIFLLAVISFTSTMLSGLYPAIYVSKVSPAEVVRSRFSLGKSVGLTRNMLLLLQLWISFALVVGTLMIYRQIDFLLNKDLGFDANDVLQINTVDTDPQALKTFKDQIAEAANIDNVASTSNAYGQTGFSFGIRLPDSGDEERVYGVISLYVDPDYLQTLHLKLVSGRCLR